MHQWPQCVDVRQIHIEPRRLGPSLKMLTTGGQPERHPQAPRLVKIEHSPCFLDVYIYIYIIYIYIVFNCFKFLLYVFLGRTARCFPSV